jgi:riboflavin synthase
MRGWMTSLTHQSINLFINSSDPPVVYSVGRHPPKDLPRATGNRHHDSMFTGIVEESGIVERIQPTSKSIELTVRARVCGRGLRIGDSLAVNGCCLTVVKVATRGRFKLARFDLLRETWRRTNLQFARPGSLVNLERPLRANGQFGGHFVTGHIDGVGKIVRWERAGTDHVLDIAAPTEVMRYIVFKGSVAVDGISLTVAGVTKRGFRIWIIPHTYEVTALRERKVGDAVNLEADLLGKYVERFVTAWGRD